MSAGSSALLSWWYRHAAQIKDPGYRLYVRVMVYSGLRPGEMRALRVRDVSGGRLRVLRSFPEGHKEKDVKNHQARYVPLAAAVREGLGQHVADLGPRDRVFSAPGGGSDRVPEHASGYVLVRDRSGVAAVRPQARRGVRVGACRGAAGDSPDLGGALFARGGFAPYPRGRE